MTQSIAARSGSLSQYRHLQPFLRESAAPQFGQARYTFSFNTCVTAAALRLRRTLSFTDNRFSLDIVHTSQPKRCGISAEDLYPFRVSVQIKIVVRQDQILCII